MAYLKPMNESIYSTIGLVSGFRDDLLPGNHITINRQDGDRRLNLGGSGDPVTQTLAASRRVEDRTCLPKCRTKAGIPTNSRSIYFFK